MVLAFMQVVAVVAPVLLVLKVYQGKLDQVEQAIPGHIQEIHTPEVVVVAHTLDQAVQAVLAEVVLVPEER
jgi:hypothetical protein